MTPGADTFQGAVTAALTMPNPRPVLVVVHETALPWRCEQLRRKYPRATIVLLTTKNNFLATNWAAMGKAAFVVTTFEVLTSRWYQAHSAIVMHRMLQNPEKAVRYSAQYPHGLAPAFFDTRGKACTQAEDTAKALTVLPDPEGARRVLAACGGATRPVLFPILELAEYGAAVIADVHALVPSPKSAAVLKALRRLSIRQVWVTMTRLGDLPLLLPWAEVATQTSVKTSNIFKLCMHVLATSTIVMKQPKCAPPPQRCEVPMTVVETVTHYLVTHGHKTSSSTLFHYGMHENVFGQNTPAEIKDVILWKNTEPVRGEGEQDPDPRRRRGPDPNPDPDAMTDGEDGADETDGADGAEDYEGSLWGPFHEHDQAHSGALFYHQSHLRTRPHVPRRPRTPPGISTLIDHFCEGAGAGAGAGVGGGDNEDDEEEEDGIEYYEPGEYGERDDEEDGEATADADDELSESDTDLEGSDDDVAADVDADTENTPTMPREVEAMGPSSPASVVRLQQRLEESMAPGGDFCGPCQVCMDPDNVASAMMMCGHTCCPECAVKWMVRKGKCTVCARPVSVVCVLDSAGPVETDPFPDSYSSERSTTAKNWLLGMLRTLKPDDRPAQDANIMVVVPHPQDVAFCVEAIGTGADMRARCPQTQPTAPTASHSTAMKLLALLEAREIGVVVVVPATDMELGVRLPCIDHALFVGEDWSSCPHQVEDVVHCLDPATKTWILVQTPNYKSALPPQDL
jgi:hypothetical protein